MAKRALVSRHTQDLIIIKGHPASIQSPSKTKNRWKKMVATEATKIFHHPLTDNDLVINITYFYEKKPRFDTDNICKPICDALNKVGYRDDSQLVERHTRVRNLDGSYHIKGVAPEIAIAITEGLEFVSIQISKLGKGVEII